MQPDEILSRGAEITKFFKLASKYRIILHFMLLSGCRPSEILAIVNPKIRERENPWDYKIKDKEEEKND